MKFFPKFYPYRGRLLKGGEKKSSLDFELRLCEFEAHDDPVIEVDVGREMESGFCGKRVVNARLDEGRVRLNNATKHQTTPGKNKEQSV